MSRVDDALLLRDTIQRIVDDKLGKERPKSSYALVTGFNPDEGTVSVIFDGDDITVDIPAGSIYPSEIGQTVKIGGSSGARIIEDVMGENLTEVKARTAQETADGKNTVNYGETPPEGTDHKDGDIWFDEGNSNMPNVWKDGGWVSIEDLRVAAIEEAQNELRQDLDTVVENGVGTKTFYKPTQPTEAESSEGDLWFDTSEGGNNELHTYVNGQWVSAADARIAAIQQAQAELASDLNDVVENGLGTRTHYTPTQPAVADSKEGDLWFDTSTAGKNAIHVFTGGAWVSAADARLAELKAAQTDMEGDITAAQQKADEAFQDAADADSKAATAQSAADAAASAAASAAGIANGKGKVLVQSTAPGSADRNAQTLWIDTTGGANTPKRWVSGTTWSAVTDKAATDAASAAATAQAKANEAKTAADAAQTTATNAQTAASNAQSTATEALTSANSKNTVTRSTADPTTPYAGRVDDIWWKMSSLSSGGRVIAQYRWSGTAWLTETIDNAVIASLDAAKITTGYLAAARIKANTLNADTVLINGSLGSIILRDGAITTPKIAVGAITAESGVVASLDAGKITVGTLDAARLAARSITADKMLIGAPGSLLAPVDANGPGPHLMGSGASSLTLADGTTRNGFAPDYCLHYRKSTDAGEKTLAILHSTRNIRDAKVVPGVTYTISALIEASGSYAGGRPSVRWAVQEQSKSGAYLRTLQQPPSESLSINYSWDRLSWQYTASPDCSTALVLLMASDVGGDPNTYVDIAEPTMVQAVGSTLIEPGAITTEKIAVGAITAQSGIIASLDAGKITVGTLAAARFAANTINADSVLISGTLGSTIIKNGAITTAKLATGAITAESGVIGSLDASKITVGKLSGARLEADAINGMQIIGATIATSTTFPRVQLDSAGLSVYKSSSVRSFFADAATGDLDVVGNFRTGTSGPRVEMTSKTPSGGFYWGEGESGIAIFGGAGAITSTVIKSQGSVGTYGGHYNSIDLDGHLTISANYSATGNSRSSSIRSTAGWSSSVGFGGSGLDISDTGAVFVRAPERVSMYTDAESVRLDKETATASIEASNVAITSGNFNVVPDGISEVSSTNIRPIRINYTGTGSSWLIPFRKGTTEWGYVGSTGAMSADDFGIQSAAGKTMVVTTTNTTDTLRVTNRRATLEMSSYTARFDIDNSSGGRFQVPAIYNVQASGSANVVVNSSGTMFRPSSSLRYKQDVQDFSPSPSILDIETKTWRDKSAVALSEQAHEYLAEIGQGPLPRSLQEAELEPCRHFGAIAEEVDALGLSELVEYDHAGRPDALKYPMFGVALIPEVRKLRDRINALEALLDTPTETPPVE